MDQTDKQEEDTPPVNNRNVSAEPDAFDVFGASNNGTTKPTNSELENYLQGQCPIKKDQTPLDWWREHQHRFPVLSKLARDYLAVSATSCACERTFSAAADVCTPSRGGMVPKTMERLVGSQAWMKEGIIPDGDFSEAAAALQAYLNSLVRKKK